MTWGGIFIVDVNGALHGRGSLRRLGEVLSDDCKNNF